MTSDADVQGMEWVEAVTDLPGSLFVVAAPSGAGKTSLVKALTEADERLSVSVSVTTRTPRPAEIDGHDYFFLDESMFQNRLAAGDFLEYAKVYDHHYGTPRDWVLQRLSAGLDVILEIDWQGARQIRQNFPAAVLVFILPPSMEALVKRLADREQDAQAVIADRMRCASDEMRHFKEFDYLVVNDEFSRALADLAAIVQTRRLLLPHQLLAHQQLLADLTQSD